MAVTAAASAVVAGQGTKPAFDVVSIKKVDMSQRLPPLPSISTGGVFQIRANVMTLIFAAYGLPPYRISGLPRWALTDGYDITARTATDTPRAGMQLMVQSLLAERFKLVHHTEPREMAYVALRLAPGGRPGTHLRAIESCEKRPDSPALPAGMTFAFAGCGAMETVAMTTSMQVQQPVIDHTGMTGTFDYVLFMPADEPRDLGPSLASITAQVRAQWGLLLEPTKGRLDVLVVDSVEPPSPN